MARGAKKKGLLPRGVWVAPWTGPNDEMVLLPVTAGGKLATEQPVVVPNGASRVDAMDRLWQIVESVDPDRRDILKVI